MLLVALYLFVARPETTDQLVVIGALAAYATAVLALRFVPQLRSKTQMRIALEIFAMVAFLTAVLGQIGGEASPLLNLYLLPIIAAALVLGKRGTVLVTVLVCMCYFLLTTAGAGVDAPEPGDPGRADIRYTEGADRPSGPG